MLKKILVTSSYYILNNKILFQPMILRVHLIDFYVFFSHPSCQTSIQPPRNETCSCMRRSNSSRKCPTISKNSSFRRQRKACTCWDNWCLCHPCWKKLAVKLDHIFKGLKCVKQKNETTAYTTSLQEPLMILKLLKPYTVYLKTNGKEKKTHAHLGIRKPSLYTVTFFRRLHLFGGASQAKRSPFICQLLPFWSIPTPNCLNSIFVWGSTCPGMVSTCPTSPETKPRIWCPQKNRYRTLLSPVRPEVHWNKDDLNDSQSLKKKYDHTLNDLGYVSKVGPIDLKQICRKSHFKHVKLFSNFFGFPLTHFSQNSGPRRFWE